MHTYVRIIVTIGVVWLLMALDMTFENDASLAATSRSSVPDVAAIDAFVHEQVQRHGIPGLALALVEGNQIIHLQGFGRADQSGRPITPQTPFILASVSKPLTALAVMQLVESGKIDLDAPVQQYLPAFRVADPIASGQIAVRHLLLHTSGVPATACDTRADAVTLEEYVAELKTVALDTPPGTQHAYCSGNYNVLGRIVETVAGQSFGAYMQQQVFAPLDMQHSFVSEQEARQAGLAQGYQWFFGLPIATHHRYNTSQLPSGYLISSVEDLAHFLVAQLNGGRFGATSVLSPDGIAAMHAPGVAIGASTETYGLGWIRGVLGDVPAIHHDGVNNEYHALIFFDPTTRRGAVLLMNSFGIVPYVSAYQEIEHGVARMLAGHDPAPSTLSLGIRYLLIDAPLAAIVALVLWPLLSLRQWYRRLLQHHDTGVVLRRRVGLRIGSEIGLPLLLLAVARLVLHGMGAQSWAEGLAVFPDFGAWLWTVALLMLMTGVLRLVLTLRVLR